MNLNFTWYATVFLKTLTLLTLPTFMWEVTTPKRLIYKYSILWVWWCNDRGSSSVISTSVLYEPCINRLGIFTLFTYRITPFILQPSIHFSVITMNE